MSVFDFRRDKEAKNGRSGESFTSVYCESPACLTCFTLLFMESCGCCIPSMWGMPGGQPGYCWDTILNKLSSWSEEMDHVSAVRLLGSPEASGGKAGLALLRDHVFF